MFRTRLVQANNPNITVIGVSVDSPEAHLSFIQNLSLNFPLASDAEGKLCGVMGTCPGYEPSAFFANIVRTAFIIEPDGTVSAIYNASGSPALISLIWDTAMAE